MIIQFKGIRIGSIVITTKKQVENSKIEIDAKEVIELVKKVAEGENIK